MNEHAGSRCQQYIGCIFYNTDGRDHAATAGRIYGKGDGTEKDQQASQKEARCVEIECELTYIGNGDTCIGKKQRHLLQPAYFFFKKKNIDQHGKAWIEKEDQPFEPC